MAIVALVDGGSKNNQDPTKRVAYGSFYIAEPDIPSFELVNVPVIAHQTAQYGNKTNNEAEYMALIDCLKFCLSHGFLKVYIGTDSSLVWNQVNGFWKIKNDRIRPLHKEVLSLITNFEMFSLSKIPRDVNQHYLGH